MKKLLILPLIFMTACEVALEPQTIGLEKLDELKCNDGSEQGERALASIDDKISDFCRDIKLYQCDKRVFSPTAEDKNLMNQIHEIGDLKVSYNLHSFNTKKLQEDDSTSEEDFLPGGEYNRTEVQCYIPGEKGRGIYGNGKNLNSAIMNAINACDTKEQE